MKIAIIYKSVHHGNTKLIAEALSKEMDAELIELSEAKLETIKKYDLIGWGSGIYFGKHHKDLLKFLEKLPSCGGKKAFIFSTSAFRKFPPLIDFDRSLRKSLLEKGFSILGSFSCRGYTKHSIFSIFGGIWKGRPNNADIEEAKEFARNILRVASDH